ncbi:MAG: CobW family GTP-binding protein [Acidobacteriota bacterium]
MLPGGRQADVSRVPVTVLTGFLGAGKTTLLNRLLSEQHGKRIAVIENEFGEIGIDHELVVEAEEEIFEMNNGCICCTVRGDLIRILGSLMKRRDKFDYILVETTGLADPGPVAQTFFVDEEIQRQTRLDGIVTVVDAKHVWEHFDANEVQEQIAFADVILINKTDLVDAATLERLEARIRAMNATAAIQRTQHAAVPVEDLLDIGAFDLDRALAVDPQFLEPEYPFEYGGLYELAAGPLTLEMQPGPDSTLELALLPAPAEAADPLAATADRAIVLFSEEPQAVAAGSTLPPALRPYQLTLAADRPTTWTLDIPQAGRYALFMQHHPEEFAAVLRQAGQNVLPLAFRAYKPDHEHEADVTSVGIHLPGDLDPKRLNAWLGELLQTQGPDIFRMKGVLSLAGDPRRFVFQGVHMIFDGRPDRPWGVEPRHNALVFIGRRLDRAALEAGFRACLASA